MMFWLLHLCIITSVLSQEIVRRITLGETNWGQWSNEIKCPYNIRVSGFRLQVEEWQGYFTDDTALNGLQLKCKDGQYTKKIEGPYGDWHEWLACRTNSHVTGFNLQSKASRGPFRDDFGATNLDFMCSDNRELLGEGIDRGHWSGYHECPTNSYFCGVKAKIERKAIDHTALNKIMFLCCKEVSSSWERWSPWSPCSVSCGYGYSMRLRMCNVQNGVGCLLKNGTRTTIEHQKKKCAPGECVVSSEWGRWTPWSPCSVSCGHGYISRVRTCNVQNGVGCVLKNGTRATLDAQRRQCSGDCAGAGNWGPWQEVSPCSYVCEGSEKKMKRECHSPPSTSFVGCRTSSGKIALAEYKKESCPAPRECKFTCMKEKGFCVKPDGTDQNDGVITLLSQEMDTPGEQEMCYKQCREYPDATGCEVILNQRNQGCYAHTAPIARGNSADNHYCWVFSKCKSEMDCSSISCDHSLSPVCGSDGVTYDNLCLLEKEKCHNRTISLDHRGKCIDPCDLIMCGQGVHMESCATDGKTYDSCDLAKTTCRNSSIRFLHAGPCKSCDKNICTEQFAPVCGSDGKTYGNQCKLKKAACDDQSIKLKHRGKCGCKTACHLNYAPICGSDGKTYGNRCLLEVWNCKLSDNSKKVKMLYNGECKGHKKCVASTSNLKVGQYNPTCTEEGLFRPLQCHPSTGHCWCVNPYSGARIPSTSMKPGEGKSEELSTAKCIVAHHKGLIGKWTITFASGTTNEFQITEDGSVRDMLYNQNSLVGESENLKEFPTSHGWVKTAFDRTNADKKKMTVYMRWWRDDRIEMHYFCGRDCANIIRYCENTCQKRYGGVQNYCCAGKGSKTITTEYLKKKRKGKDGSYSFSIQLEVFEGDIKHYDVIVTELGKEPTFPRKNPGDYSNQDILLGVDGLYVAGRIKDKSQFGKEFQIGGGKPGKDNRKRRALATPNNKPLKNDVYYGVFVRGYITEDYFMTSTWYPPVVPNDKQTGSWKIAVAVVVVIILIVIAVVLIVIHIAKRRKGVSSSSVPTTNGYNNREFQLGTNLATAPNMTLPSQPNGKTIPESYENVTLPEKPRYEPVQYKPPAKPVEKQVYEEPTEVTLPNVKPTIPDEDESWKVRPRPKATKKLASEVLPNVNNLEPNDGPAVISAKQFSEEPPKPIYETDYQDPSVHHSTTNPFHPSNMAPVEQLYQEIPHYNAIPGVDMTRPHPNTPPPEYSELNTTPAIPEPFNPQMPGYNQLGMTPEVFAPAAYSELNATNIPQALNMPMPGYNRLDPSLTSQNPNGLYDNPHYAVPNIQTSDNLYMGLQPQNPNTDSTA